MKKIHKIGAAVIVDNKLLMVRKKGKETWTSLGGRLEPGETEEECLLREIKEEADCEARIIRKLGDFRAVPVHHKNSELLLSMYLVDLLGPIRLVDEELEEYMFLSRDDDVKLPPSSSELVIPFLKKEGLLKW